MCLLTLNDDVGERAGCIIPKIVRHCQNYKVRATIETRQRMCCGCLTGGVLKCADDLTIQRVLIGERLISGLRAGWKRVGWLWEPYCS